MDNLIIVNSSNKKRGIFKSLFFNLFFKQIYIDEGGAYTFEIKNLSKIDRKFLKDVIEIICQKTTGGFISTASLENKEESIVMFSSTKKTDLDKKIMMLKKSGFKLDCFCPSEYLVGKYFSYKYKNRNVLVNFTKNQVIYSALIRQGTLLWVGKSEGVEYENKELKELLNKDIFVREVIDKEKLNKMMETSYKTRDLEKIFWKWVKFSND